MKKAGVVILGVITVLFGALWLFLTIGWSGDTLNSPETMLCPLIGLGMVANGAGVLATGIHQNWRRMKGFGWFFLLLGIVLLTVSRSVNSRIEPPSNWTTSGVILLVCVIVIGTPIILGLTHTGKKGLITLASCCIALAFIVGGWELYRKVQIHNAQVFLDETEKWADETQRDSEESQERVDDILYGPITIDIEGITDEQKAEIEQMLEDIRQEALNEFQAEQENGTETDVSSEAEMVLMRIAEDMAKQIAQNPSTVKFSTLEWGFSREGHIYAVQGTFLCSNLIGVSEKHKLQVWCRASQDYKHITPYEVFLDGELIVAQEIID